MIAAMLARLALLLVLAWPLVGTAHGHATVVETEPGDGAVLAAAPRLVRIVFNEPVSLISAQVLDAHGRNVIGADAAAVENTAVEIPILASMPRGTYVASYRVVSIDGHPIGGSLVFSVGEASDAAGVSGSSYDRAWRAVWTVLRTAFDAALLGSVGGVLFLLIIAPTGPVAASTGRIASAFALAGLILATLSIPVQGGVLTGSALQDIAGPAIWQTGLASAFGRSALVACCGLILIAAGARLPSPAARMTALAGAVVVLISFVLAGHVVTAGPRWLTVPAVVAHTSAVAFWIGSLLPLRASLSQDNAAPVVLRFSVVAAGAVALLAAAGTVIAVLQVRDFAALVTTPYGWLLVAKLGLVCGLLSLAAFNKWQLTPRLGRRDPGAVLALRRTIGAELALAAVILAATAALGTTVPPRSLQSGLAHTVDHYSAQDHHAHGLSVRIAGSGFQLMLEFTSAHAGPNHLRIALTDEGGTPVEAKELTFIAANPAAGVEPIQRMALPAGPGVWDVADLTLVPAGEWVLRVDVLVSDFQKAMLEGSVELR